MKKIVVILVLLSLLIACNNGTQESKKNEATKKAVEDVKKELVVKIKFKTNKQDVFRIIIYDIVIDDLQKKNIQIFEEVVPSTEVDQIIAKFDSNNISNNIAINVGNEQEKKVEIESIFVSYGQNQIDIKTPQEINKYLFFNKFIERDSTTTILQTKKVDGTHYPVVNFKRNLINFLKKE